LGYLRTPTLRNSTPGLHWVALLSGSSLIFLSGVPFRASCLAGPAPVPAAKCVDGSKRWLSGSVRALTSEVPGSPSFGVGIPGRSPSEHDTRVRRREVRRSSFQDALLMINYTDDLGCLRAASCSNVTAWSWACRSRVSAVVRASLSMVSDSGAFEDRPDRLGSRQRGAESPCAAMVTRAGVRTAGACRSTSSDQVDMPAQERARG